MSEHNDLLRKYGVAVTAQRLSILGTLSSHPHSTAVQVADIVRSELGTISRQAVYDSLGVLAQGGIIRRIQPSGSAALYECRVGGNHHHVVCRSCGKTEDVDCAVGHTPCLTASNDAGFIIDEAEVIYWGYCPECQCQDTDAKTNTPNNDSPKS